MRFVTIVVVLFLWLFCAGALPAQPVAPEAPSQVTPGVVWSIPAKVSEEKIWKEWFECLEKQEGRVACVGTVMAKYGASDEAVKVNRYLDGLGYAASFMKLDGIDLLGVVYPGSNYGKVHFFVNGQPPFLSVEEIAGGLAEEIRKDPLYPRLRNDYPLLGLWTDNGTLIEQARMGDGATAVHFLFPLRDGCHACRVGGYGRIAFYFPRAGLFKGVSLVGIIETRERFRDADDGKTFVIEMGKPFSVELPANPTTGYAWAFKGLDGAYFRLSKSDYERLSPQLVGSGGTSRWELTGLKAGVATLRLLYFRSWEGPEKAVREYSLTLVIR